MKNTTIATVKTMELTMGDKTIPLSKSMINQLEWFDPLKWVEHDTAVQPIGTVSLSEGIYTLFQTPRGLQRWTGDASHKRGYGELDRIILTK